MKNIQVIDGAQNCMYDIFAATDEELSLIFPTGTTLRLLKRFTQEVAGKHSMLPSTIFGSAGSENVMPKEFTE